jgi:hypothetical protein
LLIVYSLAQRLARQRFGRLYKPWFTVYIGSSKRTPSRTMSQRPNPLHALVISMNHHRAAVLWAAAR